MFINMSFFNTQGKINLEQTDIRISAENGLSFKQDQVVGIYIPPSIKYFSGKDSYLQFDVELKQDDAQGRTRLMLDSGIGGQALISQIRTYAGNRGTLLEENTQYNTYVAVKYDYSRTDTEQNKRFLTEGCGVYDPKTRGEFGSTKSLQNSYVTNQYFKTISGEPGESPNLAETNEFTNDFMVKCKMTLPLHTGIFADNEKVFPNLLTDGLYIELTLAGIRNTFRQLDSVNANRRLTQNPVFYGIDNTGAKLDKDGGTATNIYLEQTNSCVSVQNCPFVVGEFINFVEKASPYRRIKLDSPAPITGIAVEVVDGKNMIKLSCSAETLAVASGGVDLDIESGDFWVISETLDNVETPVTGWSPSYEISNVEMVVHQITMPPSYEKSMLSAVREKGGVIEFDIPSVTCSTHSTLKSDTQAVIPLNIEFSRAKSILCVPTDATIYEPAFSCAGLGTYLQTNDKDAGAGFYEDHQLHSCRTGLEGCSNCLSAYSFFLNGKQVPSRDISTKKITSKFGGIDANFLVELEKALVSAGITVNNFTEYNRNFVVGRMLAIGENAVFDGRGRSCRLNVRYEGTTEATQPSVNMLWKNFVFHIRKMVIRGNDISVEV